jgi:hypothetical protein
VKIIVPLAGRDRQFEALGEHKALTQVFGKTVIEWIAGSRPYDFTKATFLLLREHEAKYDVARRLAGVLGAPLDIVWVEQPTGGAPQTVLLCKDRIDNDDPLLIDLMDQYIDFKDLGRFLKRECRADGVIPTFESLYHNRGYMDLDPATGRVRRVSEKDRVPISTHSTACLSYFRRGSDFVRAAERMVRHKRVAANGAYMISLAYNELITEGCTVVTYPCEFIATLGSAEGLRCFEQIVRPVTYRPEDLLDD